MIDTVILKKKRVSIRFPLSNMTYPLDYTKNLCSHGFENTFLNNYFPFF